jgi:hypothetical protein
MRVLLISEGKHERDGALPTLVRRLNERCVHIEWKCVRDPELRSGHGKGHGIFKKAVRCLIYAQEQSFDAVVLVVDQDHEPERTRQVTFAQDHQQLPIRRALGVAVRTFDAWMLADETALARLLACPVRKQPDPETIDDPKEQCRRLLEAGSGRFSQSQLYAALAEGARIEEIERRCPNGFGTFAKRVRAL